MRKYHSYLRISRLELALVVLATALVAPVTSADILFAAKPMGPSSNIYSLDSEGQLKKLTSDSRWRDVMADVAADGAVVFASDRESDGKIDMQKKSATFDLYTLDPKLGEVTRLTQSDELEAHPKFSPDGNQIAFIERRGEKEYVLTLISRDGANRQTLATAEDITDFSWSPEGKRIAYAMTDDEISALKVVGIPWDERPARSWAVVQYQTTPEPENHEKEGAACHSAVKGYQSLVTSAQWSPDGRKLAYIVNSLVRQERVLRVVDITKEEDRQISDAAVQVQQPVSWSADSNRLLYSALVDYNFYFDEKAHRKVYEGAMHLFMADLQGEVQQLTEGEHLHNRPVFSPDGKQIAYLFGDHLDSRSLSVRTMELGAAAGEEVFAGVTRDSFLHWAATPAPTLAAEKRDSPQRAN